VGHELSSRDADSRRRRKSPARQGATVFLALAVTVCPPDVWSAEPAVASRLQAIAAAPANFRSSSDIQIREYDEAVPANPKKKEGGRQVDMSLDRLDPFFKPEALPPSADMEPEPADPIDVPEDEIERERRRQQRERERQTMEEISRTPQVDREAMFRATMVPRDIVDVPAGGIAEGLTRLGEEGFLMGKSWSLNYGVFLSAVFDDNVNLSSTDKQSDILLTGGANIAIRLGNDASNLLLSGTYGINYGTYLSGTDDPVLGQSFALSALYRFTKLTLGLNVAMSYGAGGTVDTGERTNRGSYFASLTANYAFSEKLAFNLAVSGASNGFEDLLSSTDTRVNAFIDYTLTPKIKLGLGGTYGTTKAEDGGTQTSQQALIRGSYTATEKLTVNGSGGVELRQTEGGDNLSPVFSIGAAYRPFERTTVTLDLSRQIFSSAVLAGQNYTATSVTLGVGQQLLPRLSFSIGIGYQFSDYSSAEEGVSASRRDNYLFVRSSLDWEAARWCRLGAFYEFSDSQSTGEGARPFSRNRVGLQVSLMF
jgi:hypothetical protein